MLEMEKGGTFVGLLDFLKKKPEKTPPTPAAPAAPVQPTSGQTGALNTNILALTWGASPQMLVQTGRQCQENGDWNTAAYCYGNAMLAEDPEGYYMLAYCTREGLGVAKDEREACRLYDRAYEMGYAPALTELNALVERMIQRSGSEGIDPEILRMVVSCGNINVIDLLEKECLPPDVKMR